MPDRNGHDGIVVAVGGPPHSGKSVFLHEFYRQLLRRHPSWSFLVRGAPDGEGNWFHEADLDLARKLRLKYGFSPEFKERTIQAVANLRHTKGCVLLDLGGLREPPNEELLRLSTHLIVVSHDDAEAEAWTRYGEAEGCTALAVIRSRLFEVGPGELDRSRHTPDQPWSGDPPLRGELWQLDRSGPKDLYEGAVERLADWLWRRFGAPA
jgi:CRISPR-associated protein Csx3